MDPIALNKTAQRFLAAQTQYDNFLEHGFTNFD
jgi:hypothetical protein